MTSLKLNVLPNPGKKSKRSWQRLLSVGLSIWLIVGYELAPLSIMVLRWGMIKPMVIH
ncbi:hypothetical protein D3C85_1773600 [compost metagenome]